MKTGRQIADRFGEIERRLDLMVDRHPVLVDCDGTKDILLPSHLKPVWYSLTRQYAELEQDFNAYFNAPYREIKGLE